MRENTVKLDNRLQLCADFVRKDSVLADVGTDHAYLPVWLCENHRISKAIALDIHALPLENGRTTILNHHLEHCIETRLSDGLSAVAENEADDIVIAGMGGELIADILDRAKWVRHSRCHLILQPMTKAEILREYLYRNGFAIQEEQCTSAEKKLYTVMSVYYTGNIQNISPLKKYCGEINPKHSETNYQYIVKTATALSKKGSGILHSDSDSTIGKQCMDYAELILQYAESGRNSDDDSKRYLSFY